MKKKNQKLLVLSSLLLCLGLSSCGNNITPSASSIHSEEQSMPSSEGSDEPIVAKAIKLSTPSNGEKFNVSNEVITSYLNASTDSEAISVLQTNKGKDLAGVSIDLSWEKDGSAYYNVHVSTNPDFDGEMVRKVSGLTPHLNLSNLIPGATYYWKVEGTVSGDVSETRTFLTEGSSVRLINASGGKNIRDLGGWKTANNGKIAYGKIYRGGLLNGYNNLAKLDSEGIKTFRDELAIATEIDLRRTTTDDGLQTSCYFNPEANYVQAEMGQYTGILDVDTWNSVSAETSKQAVSTCDAYGSPSIKKIFSTLADKNNYPVYIHCNAGADRTGTLAFLLEALCGVSESDLIKDFEITSFSSFGARYRSKVNGDSFDESGVYQNDSGNFVAFGALLKAFKNHYGSTLQEAVTYYLNTIIGVPTKDIESVKSILMEDYEKEDAVTLGQTQEILATDSVKSISLGEMAYESIVSITMDGVSLGNDISNLDLSSFANLGGEKEISVVVSTSEGNKKIYVPVDFITKEIKTADELKKAVDFGKTSYLTGHYRLANDIDFGSGNFGGGYSSSVNYFDSRGAAGFRGTLDGNGHTITGMSGYGGLFGTLGAGALVKNLTINDKSFEGKESTNILGTCVVSARLENVKFKMSGGGSDNTNNGIGWLCSYAAQNIEFKNVEFDATGRKIGHLLGGYKNWMGTTNIKFSNSSIKCSSLAGLGIKAGQSMTVSIYGFSGLSGSVGDKVVSKNVIRIGEKEGKVQLGSAYESTELLSFSYNGTPISGAEADDGVIYFPIEGNFTNADEGERELLAVVRFDNGMTVNISVGVEVVSSYEKDVLTNKTTVYLENQTSFSIDLEKYAGATVSSIKIGDTVLGNDVGNIAISSSFKNDKSLHGEQEIKILAELDGKGYVITAKVLFITKTINSFAELKETCGHYDETAVIYGYYKLGQDLGTSSDKYAWTYNETVSSKAWSSLANYGFHGTLDGNGHALNGTTVDRTWGLFGFIGDGASIKNITINDYGTLGGAERALLGRTIGAASFENVEFALKGTGSRVAESGKGWLSTWSVGAASFKNVTFNAEGKEIGTLFGNNTASLTATFESSTLKCSYIDSVTRNGTHYVAEADKIAGLTLIIG